MPGGYTVSLDELLKQSGPEFLNETQPSPQILPPPGLPWEVANQFFKSRCFEQGAPTLVHWRGSWLQWKRAHWIEAPNRVVRRWLWRFTSKAKHTNAAGEQVAWAPNHRSIADVYEALEAISGILDETEQPGWIDDRANDVIISCRNGLLSVEKRSLMNHTPLFFNATFVPFDYEPNAPSPAKWLKFLKALFPKEPEAIAALQEWFAYVISGRTNLHKILLMTGPTRGGKGAIARILRALIGSANYAGPTLSSLGSDFGLAPLLGKSLAVISDARFSGKNSPVIIERLLSISGEDALTVDRKYKDQWTGRLPCRFHIISNELPRLGDASQAIVGRLVVISTTESWLGKEDHDLEPALHAELPGILNWALDGLARLTANGGRFTRVPSAEDAIQTLRDLASPVAAFVREKCVIGPDHEIDRDTLYFAYRTWADEGGYPKSPKHVFGRDIHAAVPAITDRRPQNVRKYVGIDLLPSAPWQDDDDENPPTF
jgi:putative DNA primase/helicase